MVTKSILLYEDINKSIKATARTITKTKLTDKINSDIVLCKAGLPSRTKAVSSAMASFAVFVAVAAGFAASVDGSAFLAMEPPSKKGKRLVSKAAVEQAFSADAARLIKFLGGVPATPQQTLEDVIKKFGVKHFWASDLYL